MEKISERPVLSGRREIFSVLMIHFQNVAKKNSVINFVRLSRVYVKSQRYFILDLKREILF